MRRRTILGSMFVMFGLAACASAPSSTSQPSKTSPFRSATVNIAPASGSLVSGRLQVTALSNGVHLSGEIGGLAQGATHAIHIHEHGDCSAADGSSAGGHFNPTSSAHGRANTAIHHAGDMDNLIANASGVARVDIDVRDVVLGGGGPTDIINRAVVVHAKADDYTSQPAGNAGARVGCGVIQVSI